MRWERRIKNAIIAVALLIVVVAVSKAGLPVTHRMEEYIAFVLTTDFEHEMLEDQANQVSNWAGEIGWINDLGVLWNRIESFVAPAREVGSAAHEQSGSLGAVSGLGER